MYGRFLTKSRHGTTYYFRRRVPVYAQSIIGTTVILRSLRTGNPRLAMIRGRALATHTDDLFLRIEEMAKKHGNSDGFRFDYTIAFERGKDGKPDSFAIKDIAPGDDLEGINSHIKAFAESAFQVPKSGNAPVAPESKPFASAIEHYFEKSKGRVKASTLRTYRSKLNHAAEYFGHDTPVLSLDQVKLTEYSDHVIRTVINSTTQGLYIATVATMLNWHRVRAGLPDLTTKTLIPPKRLPDSYDRSAFSMDQLRLIFENAMQYRKTAPCKFWITIAPVFLGCRIEELCQADLTKDLQHDAEHEIWYFKFDEFADEDGVIRKSIKKPSNWRHIPIHSALIRHGFLKFLQQQQRAGFTRPFEKEWKPDKNESNAGLVLKWSHNASKWGGRELKKLSSLAKIGFNREKGQAYFHSMRHNFKIALENAGVLTEVSEALAGRRYGSAEAERYGKLKQNHRRLSVEGIEKGLGVIVALLDETIGASQ